MHWWVNGVASGTVMPGDRGLQYGDGVFETIAVKDGVPVRLERHLARLASGLDRLGIGPDAHDMLEAESLRACEGLGRAVLKLIVTRGDGGRGYRPGPTPHPTRILGIGPWPTWPVDAWQGGVDVRICDTRLARQPVLAGIKHLNRLEQVLARSEWQDDARWQEGLMLDTADEVIEGTQSNLFVVEDGRLVTPALTACGIDGIIRRTIIEDAAPELGLAVEVRTLTLERMYRCEEAFLCNSLIGVWPVRAIERHRYGDPGGVTRRIAEWLEHHDS